MRYSRTLPGPRYHTSTAVLLSEALKCLISLIGVLLTRCSSTKDADPNQGPASPLSDAVRFPPSPKRSPSPISISQHQKSTTLLTLLVPSVLYTIQNNLQFVAVSNLDAATFQVAYQGKILTTAICAVIFLGKKLSMTQCYSITMLAAGVACASIPLKTTTQQSVSPHHQDHARGIAAVSMACLISGFAGVYTESILKKTQQAATNDVHQPNAIGFWHRNLQLCLASLAFAALSVFIIDNEQIARDGFWHGYNSTVWAVIILQAIGGLTVAVVITWTDNILKGFATSASVIVSTIATALLWDFDLTPLFLIGMVAVLAATHMYTLSSAPAAPASNDLEHGDGQILEYGRYEPTREELKQPLITHQHTEETHQ
ncbi:hypothetical protein PMZ80_006636 [Knufia obscura]|uniref:UDP-galactose transporter n=2 Tax=Knufia TaxID=430999 RepID=A0AAN8ECN3_9EURO|nr:hypothetical protein PMZ80_006636 [Knufia obscura]KAK5950995.1 hypothetical protein OHC33_008067 [Knufia fluminis]